MAEPNFNEVAKQFIELYYTNLDAKSPLAHLYRDDSMLTFESDSVVGAQAIAQKLASPQFEKVKHQIATLDAQPTLNGGIMILVTGHLVDEEQRPMSYTQCFQLLKDPAGNYFVSNDIFKLIFG